MINHSIKVVIADDHFLIRAGLRSLLEKNEHILVMGEAINGKELIELTSSVMPDVVLTDIKMPVIDGVQAAKQIKKIAPDTAIVALSFMDNVYAIVDMLEAGALGYLNKTAAIPEIMEAVLKVNANVPYYCSSTSVHLEKKIAQSSFNPYKHFRPNFTEQQARIIRYISKGMSSQQIGDYLNINVRTVDAHRRNILDKLQLRSVVGITVFAIKNELISIEELP